MPEIGFVLLTHAKPSQTVRLIDRLNRLFCHPPIQWHHDFAQCPLGISEVPENVRIVTPFIKTEWAQFSLVEATVRAIEQLYARDDAPNWFILLSGADYPLKNADTILRDLKRNDFDAHISFSPLERGALQNSWQRKCFHRYFSTRIQIPSLDRRLRYRQRALFINIPYYTAGKLPYTPSLRPYAGGQWFSGNIQAATRILKYYGTNPALENHYRERLFSDESYFQTILCGDPHLRLNPINWRYVEFIGRQPHPKMLVSADLPQILISPAHFARKFDSDTDQNILDVLDRNLGLRQYR